MHLRIRRLVGTVGILAVAGTLFAAPAGAHVDIDPSSAAKGSTAILNFQVPNERADTNTVKVEIQLPQNVGIPSVLVQPKYGWNVAVTRRTLGKPVKSDAGDSITDVVSTITWTANAGGFGPDQFDLFTVQAGPLPTNVKQLEFKAIQTYSNGEVVRWIEDTPKGGKEPEFPAPVLTLAAKTKSGHGR